MMLNKKRVLILFFFLILILCITVYFFIKKENKNEKIIQNNEYTLDEIVNYNYYEKFIYKKVAISDKKSLNNYFQENKNNFLTIGCISKTVTGAGIILFSQDPKNKYLFRGKNLDITVGELLVNRKNYLDSLDNLTDIQKKKLDFINRILEFIDDDIYNTKVYKILNHTSIFADDFNDYILYSLFQRFVNDFPEDTRNELLLKGIQVTSLYYKKRNTKIDKYSNMGFMYIITIMNLMSDMENFYSEIEARIFKPLNLENGFIAGHKLSQDELKKRFKNRNYATKFNGIFVKLDLHNLHYNEMDTLNGGLISNLEYVNTVGEEISKMYYGMDNKLTNNAKKMSELFFKYKTFRSTSNDYYSLGMTIKIDDKKIILLMRGNIFGTTINMGYFIDKIYSYSNDNINNYVYKKENYSNEVKNDILAEFSNYFLKFIFFDYNGSFDEPFKSILLKSIVDEYGVGNNIDNDAIEYDINYRKKEFIEKLKEKSIENTNKLMKDTEYKDFVLNRFNIYFKVLNNRLF